MASFTDTQLAEMESDLKDMYAMAQYDLSKKWTIYMKKANEKTEVLYQNFETAKLTGDSNKIAKAKESYEKAVYNVTLKDNYYKAMVDQVTDKLSDVNQIALDYLNDKMPKIYCHSYNEFADNTIKGYSFDLVNEDAVKYLVKSGNTSILPQKKLNVEKDKLWNTKQINSQVIQGILQGESIPQISNRIFPEIMNKSDLKGKTDAEIKGITKKNKDAAVRNARTMTTGAENKGRLDSFNKATNDGVIMKKIWVAANQPKRTRDWHMALNGKEAEVDGYFENDYGQIKYPGDPEAHPANVYNCRCSIRAKILGFDWNKNQALKYSDMSATAQYYSMMDENKELGKEFWKVLSAEGKPSQVWKSYLNNDVSSDTKKKLDNLLAQYKGTGSPVKPGAANKLIFDPKYEKYMDDIYLLPGKDWDELTKIYTSKYENNGYKNIEELWNDYKSGKIKNKDLDKIFKIKADKVVEPKPDLGMYQGKSMTATFYSVKNENSALGKEFWSVIQSSDSPSVTWNQYLIGTAPKDITEKLDKILLQHKGEGAWAKPSAKVIKSEFKSKYKDINSLPDLAKMDHDAYEKVWDVYSKTNNPPYTVGEFFKAYKNGTISVDELDNVFKESVTKKAAKKAATKAAVTESDDLVKAKTKLATAQGNLDSLGNKTYSGIWKEDVTLADYEAKAASIQAKKDWYYNQIEDLTHKIDAGDIVESVANAKIAQYEKYLDDLTEFENQGKLYAQYANEYKAAAKKVKELTPVTETFGPDAYTQMRKDNAVWAKTQKQADDVLRDSTGAVWREAKTAEKNAIYEYTYSYHKFNEPLRGIEYGSNTYKGIGKADLNAGSANNGKKLNAMTDILEKSKLPQDQWFQRGCDYSGMDKFFDCKSDLLRYGTQEELEKELLGKTVTEYGFMSMGSAKGQGFSGNILMNIYAPEGTKAMYVEPFSDYGFGARSASWDGISKQSMFGDELETILQQNTDFRITKIERKNGTLYFDLEIIAQNEPQRWIP